MELDRDHLQPLAGFRRAMRLFLAASEVINKAAGITQQQYQAMLAIGVWARGPMTVKDLAEDLLLTHHGTVQLVDRLAKAGLAQRTSSSTDRRSVVLSLTPVGAALLEGLVGLHLQEMFKREPALSASLRRLRGLKSAPARAADRS
ncbi:MAG TPA: MarR family transcriptional regulator [Phenylobacterium sp.]|jgi:DNA-binding MarR family transcriptional regulator|nr:MarR family transcriptional regulator [Phenylobacterium sp.]